MKGFSVFPSGLCAPCGEELCLPAKKVKKCFPEPSGICETRAHTETGFQRSYILEVCTYGSKESGMTDLAKLLWRNEEGQDIAEYAVMLAVILVIVIGTVRLIGGNANNVFSAVASQVAQ
jgi:Flp pilus assembly pilin Flp